MLTLAGEPEALTGAPRLSNMVTRDGQVIGFWRTVVDHEEALVNVHLTRPLDAATRSALEDEVERYGRFLQLPARLVTTPRARQSRFGAHSPSAVRERVGVAIAKRNPRRDR